MGDVKFMNIEGSVDKLKGKEREEYKREKGGASGTGSNHRTFLRDLKVSVPLNGQQDRPMVCMPHEPQCHPAEAVLIPFLFHL
jgi:hypothetical protein